jgi:2-oxoglutarate ferredoxin oxidoreductase subunit gamma
MQTEIIIAGFGGQGVLFAGQLLSYAAMDEGRQVTWIPSYGPEMRGGTANCTVVIADEEIGSPLVRNPQAVIAMNLPSLDKYEPLLRPGGVLVINESIAAREVVRRDVGVVRIPGNEIAEELGDRRMTNMVLLGGLLANMPVLPLEAVERALRDHLPARHQRLLPLNLQGLRRGAAFVAEWAGEPGRINQVG